MELGQCAGCAYLNEHDVCTADVTRCPTYVDLTERDELCQLWRNEVVRLHGKEVADKSVAEYRSGWYRVGIARTWADGSIVLSAWQIRSYRRRELVEMVKNLRKREK